MRARSRSTPLPANVGKALPTIKVLCVDPKVLVPVLALSSRAGAQIYESPSPVNYRTANQEYGSQLSELLPTTTDIHREDSLDGAVCRAAILLGTAQYDTVLTRFPDPLHALQPPSSGTGRDGWEAVCVIQGTLIRGEWEQSG